MINPLSADLMEALAASIVTAFRSRNALAEDETSDLHARVRSTLETLADESNPLAERSAPAGTSSAFAPPRRRADLSRAPWRFAVGCAARDRTG